MGRAFERFMARHEVAANGCWVWTHHLDSCGYSTFYDSKRLGKYPGSAHKWAYLFFVGPVPDGMELDHLCRNRACVNPQHLEAVTHAENMRRSRVTHCKHGHEFTAENTYVREDERGYMKRQCRACGAAATKRYTERRALA